VVLWAYLFVKIVVLKRKQDVNQKNVQIAEQVASLKRSSIIKIEDFKSFEKTKIFNL